MKRITCILVLVGFLLSFAHAQEIQTRFGKNRVQYSDDFDTWYRYETANFLTYWYGKSRNVAIASMQLAEYDFQEIQNILEHRMNEKIELIVYGDLGELYQTNIGLEGEDPENVETIQLIGTKLFVHFDGNHKHLRESIREGVAKVYMYSMLYGSSFQDIVQNSFMADMPDWFKTGVIGYAKDKWNDEDDATLRYYIQDKKRPYKSFRKLSKRQPDIAGKAFWYYIGKTYGHSSISNILYLTRINRSVKSAFQYVLGEEYNEIIDACYDFHKKRFEEEDGRFGKPVRKEAFTLNSNNSQYVNMRVSPDGSNVAYAQNKNGRISIYVRNTETGKKRRLKRYGYNNPYRETDKNYPVIFWWRDGKTVAYIYEFRDVLELRMLNLETNEKYKNSINPEMNRVYSAAFIDEGNLLLNGNTEGYSDIYSYNLNTRQASHITRDFYDDLDADFTVINGIEGIVFSSNRNKLDIEFEEIDTTLAIDPFDIYFLPFEDRSKLYRLTNSIYADEFKPEVVNNTLSYITDKYGIKTVESRRIESNFRLSKEKLTRQYVSNITDKSCHDDWCFYSTEYNKRSMLFKDTLSEKDPVFTVFKSSELEELAVGPLENIDDDEGTVDDLRDIPPGWFFETEFGDTPEKTEEEKDSIFKLTNYSKDNVLKFNPNRSTADRLRFKILDMSSDLDNEPLFGGLNSYAGDRADYAQAPLGLLLKMNVGDSFEDYLFEGGIRLATNFSGYEVYLTFEDRKRKWDHFYGAYYRRRSNRRIEQINLIERNRENTHILYYQLKYPFDDFQSIRFSGTLRSDRDYALISNEETFNAPVTNTQRLGIRAEYVFDNSSQRSLNIYNGIRSKVYVEGMNRFRVQFADPFKVEPSNGVLTILGLDSRYYLPVLRKSVLAARISAGTTLGSERILYYVGGVERGFGEGFDQSTGIPDREFAFDNLAPQLRGFDRNIRNGTSYVVSTVELRVPIFRHLFSDEIKYDFIREFQVVGFMDAGTAWHGSSPYSSKNPINSASFQSGESIIINVQYYRDPLVVGYGFGFRTSLFGYFIKLDYARGVETKALLEPRFHFSLGTDF